MVALLVLADRAGNATFSVYLVRVCIFFVLLGGWVGRYTENIGSYGMPEGLISSGIANSRS